MRKEMVNEVMKADNTQVVLFGEEREEFTITSVDLTCLINDFRKEEGNMAEKRHADLIDSIKSEINKLENAGINQRNFSLVKYTDKKGEERPCYSMNKAGILQMLSKESATVRYKTVCYIEKLEKENKQLKKESYLIDDSIERAKAWIKEQEEKLALANKIEADKYKVTLAETRILINDCLSLTEATISLGLKRGNITRWAREQGYLHKTQTEVNELGKRYFKIYSKDLKHNQIGVTQDGIELIKKHLKEVALS